MKRLGIKIIALLFAGEILAANGNPPFAGICPRPQIERYKEDRIHIDETLALVLQDTKKREYMPVKLGRNLLEARLKFLGRGVVQDGGVGLPLVVLARKSEADLRDVLSMLGCEETLESLRLRQAYAIVTENKSGSGRISITACSDQGFFYGLISLCQLIQTEGDDVMVPICEIADWPETGRRMPKTSASANSLRELDAFRRWISLYRFNMFGIQYHGNNSRNPEPPFLENVKSICGTTRENALLDTVVYFCPFRGEENAYDFRKEEDREQYVRLLNRFMDFGAAGVEIDYNDWPDGQSGVPTADIINMAYRGVRANHPQAYILYCPELPFYYGMVGPELQKTLKNIPKDVWTLWTGMDIRMVDSLGVEDVRKWDREAGRKPFLWVNRVAFGSQFARPLDEAKKQYVFRGERLPRDLHELFEGVHLNAGLGWRDNRLPAVFERPALAYLATAADFLWNPDAWNAEESYERATRLIDVMAPLLGEEGLVARPRDVITNEDPVWEPISGEWSLEGNGILGRGDYESNYLVSKTSLSEGGNKLVVRATLESLDRSALYLPSLLESDGTGKAPKNSALGRNAYLIFGKRHAARDEYFCVGLDLTEGYVVVYHGPPEWRGYSILHRTKADLAAGGPHRLEAKVDYAEGILTLNEVDGKACHNLLRYSHSSLKGLQPVAGVAVREGVFRFMDFEIRK